MVDVHPFPHHGKSFGRQMALQHFSRPNDDLGHVVAIQRVDVGRIVLRLLELHANHDHVESGQYWHEYDLLYLFSLYYITES